MYEATFLSLCARHLRAPGFFSGQFRPFLECPYAYRQTAQYAALLFVFSRDHMNAFPDIPAAMLKWELRVHPNERELTRMSSEWFARLNSMCVTE